MSALPIEKGIPIPSIQGQPVALDLYPWDELEVGDSFLVPCEAPDTIDRLRQRVKSNLNAWNDTTGSEHKIATRTVEGHSLRVWRAE